MIKYTVRHEVALQQGQRILNTENGLVLTILLGLLTVSRPGICETSKFINNRE